jgi:ABC-type Na+ transport system ATPase subunit NatA
MGLDIRFRSILHRKLKEWKQNKLIIIGTSDQAEADAIGDKVWVLQNGRAIDPSTVKAGKMMTQIILRFRK